MEPRSLCSERSNSLPWTAELVGQRSWSKWVPLTDLAAFQQEVGKQAAPSAGGLEGRNCSRRLRDWPLLPRRPEVPSRELELWKVEGSGRHGQCLPPLEGGGRDKSPPGSLTTSSFWQVRPLGQSHPEASGSQRAREVGCSTEIGVGPGQEVGKQKRSTDTAGVLATFLRLGSKAHFSSRFAVKT